MTWAPAFHASAPSPKHSLRQVAAELGIGTMSAHRREKAGLATLREHLA